MNDFCVSRKFSCGQTNGTRNVVVVQGVAISFKRSQYNVIDLINILQRVRNAVWIGEIKTNPHG